MYSRRSCFSNFHFFLYKHTSSYCTARSVGSSNWELNFWRSVLLHDARGQQDLPSLVFTISLSLSLSRNSCGSRCSATALREQASAYSAIWDPPSHVIVQSTRVCTDSTLLSFVVSYRVDYSRKRVFVVIMQVIVVAERVLFHLGGLWKKG